MEEDGGSETVIWKASEATRAFMEEAEKTQRDEPCPVSKLIIGTQCGGSDALSGLTANPSVGYLADWIVNNGGASILTEG